MEEIVKKLALEQGFDLVRVTSAQEFQRDKDEALERIGDGLMDGLPWFDESRVRRGADPKSLLPGAKSVICLGLSYLAAEDEECPSPPAHGRVARYARLRDYHRVMKRRMREFVGGLSEALGAQVSARWYVDDGPMLDRAAANRSGLGWFGKNTNILTPTHGSWVFLGQIITDLQLTPDIPLAKTCGECVRCIDACPTGAIVAPYVLDNTRCISYLTIENRGPIPRELRPLMLDWVFGCDICQDVCPVNRKAAASDAFIWERPSAPGRMPVRNGGMAMLDLVELLQMTEDEFRLRFSGTPVMRAKWDGMRRNACVALGNLADPASVPALQEALKAGTPLVRSHAAWALGKTDCGQARSALRVAEVQEQDQDVLEEVRAAIQESEARLVS